MRGFLKQRNQELVHGIEVLLHSINGAQIPTELQPYEEYIVEICGILQTQINHNLARLRLNQPDILEDVLSETTKITWSFRLLSAHFSIPILRASKSDRLCLAIIGWLHREHPETLRCPPAVTSGKCSIFPFVEAPIYRFPSVEQRGLLYQPLLFHEFGHFLYRRRKPEMDDLVSELRQEVIDLLRPVSQRNDRYSEERAAERQTIANTWYNWAQELFCDAVGFEIGGPSFLQAFSSFVGVFNQGDFYRQPEDLRLSEHPVNWLRVRFLTERAASAGFADLAKIVEKEWRMIAQTMGVVEDYHGFYHESLSKAIKTTIQDMLTEASPRKHAEAEANGGGWCPTSDSPIRLLNWAWQIYDSASEQYSSWQAEQIRLFLGSSVHS